MLKFKLRLAPLLKVVFMYSIRGSSLDLEKAIIYLDVQFGMYTVILPSYCALFSIILLTDKRVSIYLYLYVGQASYPLYMENSRLSPIIVVQ